MKTFCKNYRKLAKENKNAIRTALLVFVIGIVLVLLVAAMEKKRFHDVLTSQTRERLSKIRVNLEVEINASFYLSRGLTAYIATHPNIDKRTFRYIADILLRHTKHIRNIALAPDNIVEFLYPEQGNEKALGLDYQQNRELWPSVKKIMATGKSMVAGPINLVQGGTAFICRSPIFLLALDRDYGDNVYWGVASIVINKDSLFREAGFDGSASIRLAMRGVDGLGAAGGFIGGDNDIFQENPVFLNVSIPGGSWQLAAVPQDGWDTPSPYLLPIYISGLLLTWAIAILAFFWVQSREQAQHRIKVALTRARKANHAKSAFLANMSHEIRTPMNSIIGRSILALDNKLDKVTRSHLEMISQSSENLLALINDILDFSRIEAGELKIEHRPFDLKATVDACLKTVHVLLEDKDKSVQLDSSFAANVPRAVIGDALRLRQILLNLLSNSVKFTETGSITLSLECLQRDDETLQLQFRLQDTGIGIAQDKLLHIFDKFAQEDSSSTRKYGGTGLGLAICRELCHLMGGDIEAESIPGQGSVFSFTLCFHPCDSDTLPTAKEPEKIEQVEIAPLNILLVEDNEPNRILVRMVLERGCHTITEAHDGLQALTLMMDHDFDVVLMDVQMPTMDGLTATRNIRAAEQGQQIKGVTEELAQQLGSRLHGRHIPIIAMTANAMSGDRGKCLAAGMDQYLSKPFNPDGFTAILVKLTTDHLLPEKG